MATNPWFWAFFALLGWCVGVAILSQRGRGSIWIGAAAFLAWQVPRALLPLPFVEQPRLAMAQPWTTIVAAAGVIILACTLLLTVAAFRIVPWSPPTSAHPLRTTGVYALVRHPLMLRDSFWPLGWSLLFGSIVGIALTPLWLLGCWFMTVIEERRLVVVYGDSYMRYRASTPRLLPLPRRRGANLPDHAIH
jgi:protein-S-isoprenylcysteine O-methyltransferase Ste14